MFQNIIFITLFVENISTLVLFILQLIINYSLNEEISHKGNKSSKINSIKTLKKLNDRKKLMLFNDSYLNH